MIRMAMINGKDMKVEPGETLSALLARSGFTMTRIAVEVNGDIIPRASRDTYEVKTDDRIEVVSMVGGG